MTGGPTDLHVPFAFGENKGYTSQCDRKCYHHYINGSKNNEWRHNKLIRNNGDLKRVHERAKAFEIAKQ